MILNHLLKKFQIIRICKLQRQQLNLLVKKIGVIVGYVNQWKAKLKVYVVWTQMKFLMIILKVIISFISFIISFTTEAATWTCGKVSFLIKLQTWDLQLYYKRDSGTGVFLWVLQRFKEHRFNVVSTLSFGWCDVATWGNVKSTLKQRCVFQRWNLQHRTTLNQCCVFQRWYEQR